MEAEGSKESEGSGRYFSSTFSDKLNPEDLPSLAREVFEAQNDAEGRDKLLLSALTLWSGCAEGVRGKYHNHWIYPPTYTLINAPTGALKGDIADCIKLIEPVNQVVRNQSEEEYLQYKRQLNYYEALSPKEKRNVDEPKQPPYKMVVIPANTSATAFYQQLSDNGGGGVLFETEADTLAKAMK